MGYTHYWQTPKETYSREAWTEFCDKVEKLIAASPSPLANGVGDIETVPVFTDDELLLNGVGDNSHETLYLLFNDERWQFCKTQGKPYDVVVTAILLLAQKTLGYRVSSDGGVDDWQEGINLVKKVLNKRYSASFLNKDVNYDYPTY